MRPIVEKMGIRPGLRAYFVNAPDDVRQGMDLPALDVPAALEGRFDHIHVFVTTQDELDGIFPRLRGHLAEKGRLWVSWPKGRRLGTDLDIKSVIRIGYDHGLVESTCLSVDAVWSALKFTHPKPGKVYANSYGRLPGT